MGLGQWAAQARLEGSKSSEDGLLVLSALPSRHLSPYDSPFPQSQRSCGWLSPSRANNLPLCCSAVAWVCFDLLMLHVLKVGPHCGGMEIVECLGGVPGRK